MKRVPIVDIVNEFLSRQYRPFPNVQTGTLQSSHPESRYETRRGIRLRSSENSNHTVLGICSHSFKFVVDNKRRQKHIANCLLTRIDTESDAHHDYAGRR